MYVYLRSEPGLWTVGFYKPDGKWEAESDHDSRELAAARVATLNGGQAVNAELLAACQRMLDCHQAAMNAAQSSSSTFIEKTCECGACDEARAAIAKAEGR